MSGETDALAGRLEEFRSYLLLLARLHLDPRLKGKVDVSGVVQQTLWEGHRALVQSPFPADAQLAPLLRRLLANNLADEVRKCYADKRDVDRERAYSETKRSAPGAEKCKSRGTSALKGVGQPQFHHRETSLRMANGISSREGFGARTRPIAQP
jgi:hypothetical protein